MTRRKRSPMLRASLVLWAAVLVLAVAVTVLHVVGWIAATAAIAGAAYVLGRRMARPRAVTRGTGGRAAVRADPAGARARRNGWEHPAQTSTLYSRECATAESQPDHLFCFDPRCQCPCGHPQNQPATPAAPLPDKPPF
jgi:hypothetical protein